jgi:SAM-dependent methyltransferase
MLRPARPLRDALACGDPVADAELDLVFPDELRERSAQHWTPVAIARRAAALLAPSPGARVLDVGAGAGKLCLVGASLVDATWWGVEHDPALVAAANHAAWSLDVERRVRFVRGDGSRLDWTEFDAFYFYNPFASLLLSPHASPFVRYAVLQATHRRIEHLLTTIRRGARIVTYYGLAGPGSRLPDGFTLAAREPAGGDALELWIRD